MLFVNSVVGRKGNIGARTPYVLGELQARGARISCVCRDAAGSQDAATYYPMKWLGQVARALKAIRIFLLPGFHYRALDIFLFEAFARLTLRFRRRNAGLDVAYIWESCPRLIRACQDRGARVALDVPIAPNAYVKALRDAGRTTLLTYDRNVLELERQSFELADRIIAPSRFVRDEIVKLGIEEEKIAVIEFGVSSAFPQARHFAEAIDAGSGIDFCFLGAVNLRKGIAELIDAWDRPQFATDRLHLFGRVFPQIRSLLASRALPNVYAQGPVDPYCFLPECNVFVFPSWMEGSAKAVYEAMACGLPCIVTAASGSIVRNGIDGFVIEAGDTGALADAMLWFRKNPARIREMGSRARERAQACTWSRYGRRVAEQVLGMIA